jgi:glycosyltransferase involved in cell wall biosynthesis
MPTNTTTFSVVVTCYNYKDYVIEAVDSALAQSRAAAQIIVVDDGSTDGSTQLLQQRYGDDARVTLVCVENGGQLSAFQQGVAHARSDVICFLDADDRWSPDYLAKIGQVFDERRDIDFVFSDIRLFGKEERTMGFADRAIDFGYTVISTYMLAQKYGAPTSALAMRAPWAHSVLELPSDMLPTWRICADNCLVFGTSILGARKYYLPTGGVHYRTHGNNGWWGSYSVETEFLNRFRSRCLIEHYARRIGLTVLCVEDTKYEFKTKVNPSWREAKRYAGLFLQRRTSWPNNLERAFKVLAQAWRHRHQAPIENRVIP